MRRYLIPAALLLLVPAAPAGAQDQQFLNDLRNDGQVNPCNYSPDQLRKNLKGLPPDVKQYAPVGQLTRPCGGAAPAPAGTPQQEGREAAALGGAPPGGGPPRPDVPKPPSPGVSPRRAVVAPVPAASAETGADAPGWLVALLSLLALVGLAALLANRIAGWSLDPFLRRLRAGFVDAGERTADSLAQMRERLTPGG